MARPPLAQVVGRWVNRAVGPALQTPRRVPQASGILGAKVGWRPGRSATGWCKTKVKRPENRGGHGLRQKDADRTWSDKRRNASRRHPRRADGEYSTAVMGPK